MTAVLLLMLVQSEAKTRDVTCPYDGTNFRVQLPGFAPAWGGIDADQCPHPSRPESFALRCIACAGCGYAALPADFEKPLSPDQKKAIAATLAPWSRQPVPAAERFDRAARIAVALGRPPQEVARLHLFAAWGERIEGAVYLTGFDEFEELAVRKGFAKTPLDLRGRNKSEADLEAAGKLERDFDRNPPGGLEDQLTRYLLVYVYRLHGELERALKWTTGIREGENSVIDEGVARMKKSIESERRHLRLAAAAFRNVSGVPEREQATIEYLLGEIHRRLGEPDLARAWFDRVTKRNPTKETEGLLQLARRQAALVAAPTK